MRGPETLYRSMRSDCASLASDGRGRAINTGFSTLESTLREEGDEATAEHFVAKKVS